MDLLKMVTPVKEALDDMQGTGVTIGMAYAIWQDLLKKVPPRCPVLPLGIRQ